MNHNLTLNPDRKTTLVVLSSAGVLLTWSFGSSIMQSGPFSASIITYGLYVFYWLYTWITKNALILRLLIFGTVAGLLELVTDHYLVETIDSLVYPGNEAMIWSSPAYMPFAWSNVLLQLGFIGILIHRKLNLIYSALILGVAGGMYIPLYEHLAKDAGWWWYHDNTPMLLNAPVYVIVCEALISFSLPFFLNYSSKHAVSRTVALGVAEGAWILLSAYLAYFLAG